MVRSRTVQNRLELELSLLQNHVIAHIHFRGRLFGPELLELSASKSLWNRLELIALSRQICTGYVHPTPNLELSIFQKCGITHVSNRGRLTERSFLKCYFNYLQTDVQVRVRASAYPNVRGR